MSFFITATGTNVGKTMFSALVMACYGADFGLVYWKPLQTGEPEESDATKVKKLTGLPQKHFRESLYHFKYPASPHYSAYLEGKEVNQNQLIQSIQEIANQKYIIEGVGGLNVPINNSTLLIEILAVLKIPVILVVSSVLGTINHSLLSLEALQNRNIPVIGFYMYGKRNDLLENNIQTIISFSKITYLGNLYVPEKIQSSEDFLLFAKQEFDKEFKIKAIL